MKFLKVDPTNPSKKNSDAIRQLDACGTATFS